MSATADIFAGLERAGLRVTAMRFGVSDVTTPARPSQLLKSFRACWRCVRNCLPRSDKNHRV